jgi:hypothetical protein
MNAWWPLSADLTLIPPDAFNPQPAPLNLYDAHITAPPP